MLYSQTQKAFFVLHALSDTHFSTSISRSLTRRRSLTFVNNDWTFAESSNGAKLNGKGLKEREGEREREEGGALSHHV